MTQKLNLSTVFLCLAVATLGLAVFAYLGFYNRYWADDWCYNNDIKHQGIVTAVVGNYFVTGEDAHRGYSTNRYSLTLFSGLLYLPGMLGTQILASLTILLWLIGLFWTGRNLNQAGVFTTTSILISASGLLLFYTLYLSPHRFQILYWRTGVLTYSSVIIFGLFILGLITSQLTREHPSKTIIYATALISFIGGGFSDIGCTLLFSSLTILLMGTWLEKRKSKEWAIKTYSTIFTAWVFVLVALIALVISPSNARYLDLNKNPNDPFLVPFLSLRYAFDFILYSLLGLPLPHAILFIAFVGLGILSHTAGNAYDIRRSAWIALLTVLITYLLIVAIVAPTTYLYSAPPDPRGQSLARFVLLAGLSTFAWIIGATVAKKLNGFLMFLPAILLLVVSAYTLRATLNVYRELPGFIERAQLWDQRDAQIKDAIAQGITQIEIIPIDTKEINTRDIIRSEAFGKWVTDACGVRYYDAEAMMVAP